MVVAAFVAVLHARVRHDVLLVLIWISLLQDRLGEASGDPAQGSHHGAFAREVVTCVLFHFLLDHFIFFALFYFFSWEI